MSIDSGRDSFSFHIFFLADDDDAEKEWFKKNQTKIMSL